MVQKDKIVVVDMGSQYVSNFERSFSEKGMNCEIISHKTTAKKLLEMKPKGIIISGGPYSTNDSSAPKTKHIIKWAYDSNTPLLGVCFGHQAIARLYNSLVDQGNGGEYGFTRLDIINRNALFEGIPKNSFVCWMSHKDRVERIPNSFKENAGTSDFPNAAIKHTSKNIYGLQFHPEVTHTQYGDIMLANFGSTICGLKLSRWDEKEFIKRTIVGIEEEAKNKKIIAAVSGGVDSTVAAVLAKKAVGKNNIRCVHVDTGLMKKNESREVVSELNKIGLNVKCINASDKFIKPLKNAIDSDTKRKIIGEVFIRIFEEEAKKFGAKYLLQATIAPDVIESTRGQAKMKLKDKHGGCIKLHHNVGGLPDNMDLELLEPLKNLFKYQVRILARSHLVEIPPYLSERQPEPGPSGAVRIVDNVTPDKVYLWQQINHYVEKTLSAYNPTQYFSILMPNMYLTGSSYIKQIKSVLNANISDNYELTAKIFKFPTVGVKGDERCYGKAIGLDIRKNNVSIWRLFDYVTLLNIQSQITGKIDDVVRVMFLNSDVINPNKKYAVIIRSVDTRDFMTAMPSDIPQKALKKIDKYILKNYPDVGATFYDYSTKPSATIEYI